MVELWVEGQPAWAFDVVGPDDAYRLDIDGVGAVLLASTLIGTVRAVRSLPGAPMCNTCGQLLPASDRGSVNDQFKRRADDGERGGPLLPGQPEDGTDVDLPLQDQQG